MHLHAVFYQLFFHFSIIQIDAFCVQQLYSPIDVEKDICQYRTLFTFVIFFQKTLKVLVVHVQV